MKVVCATLGDERNLGSRGNAFICPVVAGGDAKFLHRIKSHGEHRSKSISTLFIHRNTIEGDVALVAVRTIYRAAARIFIGINVRTLPVYTTPA